MFFHDAVTVGGEGRRNCHLYAAAQRPVGAGEDKQSTAGWRFFCSCFFSDEGVVIYGTTWTVRLCEALKQTKREIEQQNVKQTQQRFKDHLPLMGASKEECVLKAEECVFFFFFWFSNSDVPISSARREAAHLNLLLSSQAVPDLSGSQPAGEPRHTHTHTLVQRQHYTSPVIFPEILALTLILLTCGNFSVGLTWTVRQQWCCYRFSVSWGPGTQGSSLRWAPEIFYEFQENSSCLNKMYHF